MRSEEDFEEARHIMVATQVRGRGVQDVRVLNAMRKVPRHRFVPATLEAQAYEDRPLPIGRDQTISQPYMVGLMTALLEVQPGDRVLEIGTGSGYQAAILAELGATVFTIERHAALAQEAEQRLRGLGYGFVTVLQGDGTLGYPPEAPYAAIIVTAGAPDTPPPLKEQLAEGGRLICPFGPRDSQQLVKWVRRGAVWEKTLDIRCVFVPLIGTHGWPETQSGAS